MTSTLNQYWNQ